MVTNDRQTSVAGMIGGPAERIDVIYQQFELSHTELKPKLPHTMNYTNILEEEMKRQTKMAASTEH